MVLRKILAAAMVLATLLVSGTALGEDTDEDLDPSLSETDDGLTEEPSTDDVIYCRFYGSPPTLYCVI